MVFRKTIVHVYTSQNQFSFGEFVRGTLFLLSYANKNNMILQLNLEEHAMSTYIDVNNFDHGEVIPKIYYDDKDTPRLIDDLTNFKEDSLPLIAIRTNIGIHKNEIDPLSILQFNKLITFTKSIEDNVALRLSSDLINSRVLPSITDSYNVINMYLADTRLDRNQIQSLSTQIRNSIDLSKTSIVIATEYIRRTLTGFLGGLHVPLSTSSPQLSSLEDSIIDFIIASKAKKIYTFTEYNAKLKKVTYDVRESTSLSTLKLPELYYITTTFAGIFPETDFTDGTTKTAAFSYPCGITEDSSENVYVADTMNNCVRKIQGSTVTTLAGSADHVGSTNGIGGLLYGPTGIAVNGSGTIYVLDAVNGLIRTIQNGTIGTLAGSTAGFQDGQGSSVKFKFLYSVNP